MATNGPVYLGQSSINVTSSHKGVGHAVFTDFALKNIEASHVKIMCVTNISIKF